MWHGRKKLWLNDHLPSPPLWTDEDLKGFLMNPSWESFSNRSHKIILTILLEVKKGFNNKKNLIIVIICRQ